MADRAGPVPREAVDYLRRKELRPGWDYRDVWREEHGLMFTVANMMQLDLLADVQDSIARAAADGTTMDEWKRRWHDDLRKRGWWGRRGAPDPDDPKAVAEADLYVSRRLDVIWRVNMAQAAQAGAWERGARSKAHPYVLYRVGPSREHRRQHLAWDGVLLPKGDRFWAIANPKNGWGCKCYTVFVTEVQRRRYARDGVAAPVAGDDEPGTMPIRERRPELRRKDYWNPRKGRSYRGYEGIDPGFEYNPGTGRLEQLHRAFRHRTHDIYRDLRPAQAAPASRVVVDVQGAARERAVQRAVRAVGRVHGVPEDLAEATTVNAELPAGRHGEYDATARRITIATATDIPDIAWLHEWAHHLDDYWLLARAQGWRAVIQRRIEQSAAWRAVDEIVPTDEAMRKEKEYALDPAELWARAYAQWIAWRSRHRRLLDHVDAVLGRDDVNRYSLWSVQDFAPIAQTIDRMMVVIGWAKHG